MSTHELFYNGKGAIFRRNIYSATSAAKESLLYLQESGSLESVARHSGKRTNLDSYLFFIVTSGSGILKYESETYTLKQNDCIFIDCNKPYLHQSSDSDQWTLTWAHFNGKPARTYYKAFCENNPSPVFHTYNPNDFINITDWLTKIESRNSLVQDFKNAKLLTDLCTLCCNATENSHKTDDSLNSVVAYLDLHYCEKLSLEQIATRFYIGKFALAHNFKASFGITVGEYITKKRITKAKEMLRYTQKSIEQISEECGICDANYFSKVFKKSEGYSASEYRKKW